MKNKNKLFSVTSFTYIQGIKSVWFWAMLAFGFVTLLVGMNYDKIISLFEEETAYIICVIDETEGQIYAPTLEKTGISNCTYEVIDLVQKDSVTKGIQNNESKYNACLTFSADGKSANIVYGDNIEESTLRLGVLSVVDSLIRIHIAGEMGIDPVQTTALLNDTYVTSEYIAGDAMAEGYLLVIIFLIVLYLLILLYGAILSNSVVEEKGNRIMETLLCYSDSMSLMFGKILGFLFLAVTHIVIWVVASVAMYSLFIDSSSTTELVENIFTIKTAILFAGCLILGFLFYAIAYVAAASFADNAQDSTNLILPMTIVLMVAFVLSLMSMRHSDQILNLILSFCPFIAPIILFGNVVYHHMSTELVILSFVIQIAEILILAKVGSSFYRRGIFHYGGVKLALFGMEKKASKT